MKEVTPQDKDQITIVKQAEQEKQHRFLARLKLKPGQTLYEVNLTTGEAKPATFEKAVANFRRPVEGTTPRAHLTRLKNTAQSTIRTKVKVNEDCVYIPALNLKNVIKKLKAAKTKI